MQFKHSVQYGSAAIKFRLQHSPRKTLGISVLPDLSVVVTAPANSDIELVKSKIKKRAVWILKQQDFFSTYLPTQPTRRYVSGETHYYMGRQYRLKVAKGDTESVKLRSGYIHVETRNKQDKNRIAALLNEWFSGHARKQFHNRLEIWWERVRKHDIPFPNLRLRHMAKRWGTCTRNGAIYLNPNLIKASSSCIDYVILHELCHLKHAHHGKEFYQLLLRIMPDWEQRKSRLEKVRF